MNFEGKWENILLMMEKLSKREKIIVLIAAVSALLLGWQSVVLEPMLASKDRMIQQTFVESDLAVEAETNLVVVKAEYAFDPNRVLNEELERIRQRNEMAKEKLDEVTSRLIDPQKMVYVLKAILEKQNQLKLLRFESHDVVAITERKNQIAKQKNELGEKTLASKEDMSKQIKELSNANSTSNDKSNMEETGLYRHGITLEFEGDYKSVIAYLKAIEAMPWKLYWKEIHYEVIRYPRAMVGLQLETLSTEREWIGV